VNNRECGQVDFSPQRIYSRETFREDAKQYLLVLSIVGVVGVLNVPIARITGPRVPGLIFLLAVVLLALFIGRGPVFMAGALSALIWNYFFLPPRMALRIASTEDAVLFGLYFVVSIVLGQLVARIRLQEQIERQREKRATALYQLTRELAQAGTRDEVIDRLISEVSGFFGTPAAVLVPEDHKLALHPNSSLVLEKEDLASAEWVFQHREVAGNSTGHFSTSSLLHLPLMTERTVLGVLSLHCSQRMLATPQRDLLETYTRQAALVLDRVALRAAAEQSKLVAESERLSNALLNSISHELRTPLAAITSATGNLAEAKDGNTELRRAMIAEIQEATTRLNRLVSNLLEVTRLESGHVQQRLEWCDVEDLIQATVRSIERELMNHPVKVEIEDKLPLARLDFTLTQQALSNLLLNAVAHTPGGTMVVIQARSEHRNFVLTVADTGPGLPLDLLQRSFEKFIRGPNARAGGSGLGLAIVKGFIEAQAGKVSAANRPTGGAIFLIQIPQTELPPVVDISA